MNTATLMSTAGRRASALTPTAQAFLLGITAAVIWGSYLAMARAGVVSGLAAADLALLRYGIAGAILLPWVMRRSVFTLAGVPLWQAMILTALAGPLFVLISVSGYQFAPLAHGAVIQPAVLTLTGMALAAIVLGDRPPRERLIGVGVIIVGIATIAGPAFVSGTPRTLFGDALFATSGAMWAMFTILTKRWALDPIRSTAVVSVLSAVIYVPIYLTIVGTDRLLSIAPSTLAAHAIVQGVLSGVVAVIAFSKAVQLIGPGRAAVFPALVPAVATLIGIPVTGEWPTNLQWGGLAMVSLGLLVVIGWIRVPVRTRHTA